MNSNMFMALGKYALQSYATFEDVRDMGVADAWPTGQDRSVELSLYVAPLEATQGFKR